MTATIFDLGAVPVIVPDLDETVTRVPVGPHHSALVDTIDLHLIEGIKWALLRGHNGKLYAYRRRLYMHRLIAQTPPGHETDHVNGDGLDNRRANLRVATRSQNKANMWKPRRTDGRPPTSAYKGVSWARDRQRWLASIQIDGRTMSLGRYASEVDAARAYDAAALSAWGDFAVVNFPDGAS